MNLRFRVTEPNSSGSPDYIINGRPLMVVSYADLAVTVKVDNTIIFSTSDLSSVSSPVSNTTTTGLVCTTSIEDTDFVKVNIDFHKGAFHSADVEIEVNGYPGYLIYNKKLKIFNYDIGNNSNQTYEDSTPINKNVDFDVVLFLNDTPYYVVNGVQIKPYADFFALRKPFTDLIYLYAKGDVQGTFEFYNSDDELLATGNVAVISSKEDIVVYAKNTITNGTANTSDTQTIYTKKDIPNWSAEIQQGIGDIDGMLNNEAQHMLAFVVTTDDLSRYYINDSFKNAFENFEVYYNVVDHNGTVIDSGSKTAIFDTNIYEVTVGQFDFTDITPSNYGDYVVQVGMRLVGINSNSLISSSLIKGEWYSIEESGNGTDFTTIGASNNNIKTAFQYNGNDIVFEDGDKVMLLNNIYLSIKNNKISVDNFYTIKQTGCKTYTIYNNGFVSGTLAVYKLNSNKEFELDETVTAGTVNLLSSIDITLSSDNIYKAVLTVNDIDYTYIIAEYCSLRDCLLEKIKDAVIECDCAEHTSCSQNKCEKYYDFNTIVITATTYFNLLQAEYGFNYLYTSLSPNKLDELYEIKQVLDKLNSYCTTCSTCKTC